jgi:hypothetical protein
MKLPNGDRAEISMEKLIGYCLNLNHPKGENKASAPQDLRGFQNLGGLTSRCHPTFAKFRECGMCDRCTGGDR